MVELAIQLAIILPDLFHPAAHSEQVVEFISQVALPPEATHAVGQKSPYVVAFTLNEVSSQLFPLLLLLLSEQASSPQ